MRHAKPNKFLAGVNALGFKSAALTALILGLAPLQAQAVESCNAAISIYGVEGPPTFFEGDRLTLKATIGAGQIRDSARVGGNDGENPFIDFTGIGYGVDCGGKRTMDNLSDCKPVGFGGGGDVGHNIEFEGVTYSDCPTDDPDELAKWPPLESNNIVPIPVLNGVVRQYYDPVLESGEKCNVDVTFTVKDLYKHDGKTETWVTQALGVPFDNYTPGDNSDDMLGTCSNGLGAGDYAKAQFEVQSCGIEVEKQVSLDGETWYDADDEASAPKLGPNDRAYYRLVVKNTGTADYVEDLTVVDTKLGVNTTVSPDFDENGEMIIGGPSTVFDVAEACAKQLEIGEGFWDNTASVEGTCRAAGEGNVSRVFAVDDDKAFINCLKTDPRLARVNIQKSTNGVDADDPANAPYIRQGEEVTWTYVVTNTGVEGLNIDSVIDDDEAVGNVTKSCDKWFLASEEQATCTAKGVAGLGLYKNTATVNATSAPSSKKVQDDDPSHYYGMVAAIDLTKTPEPAVYSEAGETITYTFKVTNLSNVPLTDVTVTDPLPNLYGLSCGSNSLAANGAVGDSTTCTAKYDITLADVNAGKVDNTATATGTAPNGDKPTDDASATISTSAFDRLTLVKTAVPLTYSAAGEVIGYSYKLTNAGTRTLYAPFSVFDDKIDGQGSDVDCPGTPASIDPGEYVTCTGSYTIVPADIGAESVTNRATGTAKDGDDGDVDSNEDTETVYYTGIVIFKKVHDGETFVNADTVEDAPTVYYPANASYQIIVRNIGAVALENVTVTDATLDVNHVIGNLPVGGEVSLASAEIEALFVEDACESTATLENTAVVTGNAATSGQTVGDSDKAFLVCIGMPEIAVEKLISIDGGSTYVEKAGPVEAEHGALYKIVVSNPGEVDLENVEISDPMIPNSPFYIGDLDAGASVTVTDGVLDTSGGKSWSDLNVAQVCGSSGMFDNTVTATGYSTENPSDNDSATDTATLVCVGKPDISITKDIAFSNEGPWLPADNPPYPDAVYDLQNPVPVWYRLTVKNESTKDIIEDVVVNDNTLDIKDFVPTGSLGKGILDKGESVVIESGELPALHVSSICAGTGEMANVASVEGYSEAGNIVQDSDKATVECFGEPALMVEKYVTDGVQTPTSTLLTALAPADAYYSIVLKNVGNVPLENVVINDDMLGIVNYVPKAGQADAGEMAVGEIVTITSGELEDLYVPTICDGYLEFENTVTAFGEDTTSSKTADAEDSVTLVCEVPVDICAEGGKPESLGFIYSALPYTDNLNAQDENIVEVDPYSPVFPSTADIKLFKKNGGGARNFIYTFEDVSIGSKFWIDGNSGVYPSGPGNKLYPNIYLEIWDDADTDGEAVQTIFFHGSCSEPLFVGDQFGGVTLYDYEHSQR